MARTKSYVRKIASLPSDDKQHRNTFFRRLVNDHGRYLDSYLYVLERDSSVREELWADVIYLAHCHLDELQPLVEGQLRAWLRNTARNLVANHSRKASTRRRTLQRLARQPVEAALSAEELLFRSVDEVENNLRNRQMEAALEQLSAAHQEVLVLHALGLSGPEIARNLGIGRGAARSRLMRARAAFVKAYKTLEEDTGDMSSEKCQNLEAKTCDEVGENHG